VVNCSSGMPRTPAELSVGAAVNLLTGKIYAHHPVMMQLDLGPYSVEAGILTEWNGLRVPARFDCDIFNNNTAWGSNLYFTEQAARWTLCWQHFASLRSGLQTTLSPLPVVDEEYTEMVATFQSVLRAKNNQPYVVAEYGARWGTWGARAIAFLQKRRPQLGYKLHLVESYPESCRAIGEVMALNRFNYTMECARADGRSLNRWLSTVDHVDLLDLDIQGAEHGAIREAIERLEEKAYRITIATHQHRSRISVRPEWAQPLHDLTKKFLLDRGWLLVAEMPHMQAKHAGMGNCVEEGFRGRPAADRHSWRTSGHLRTKFDWERVLREGCYVMTERGPVCQADGELVMDNPKFVAKDRQLRLSDTFLRVDDLL